MGEHEAPMGYGNQGAVKSPHFRGLLFPNPRPAASNAATGHAAEVTVKPACGGQAQRSPSPPSHTKSLTPAASLSPPGHQAVSYRAHTPCQVPQSASRPHLKISPTGPEEGKCSRILTYQSSPSYSVHFDCIWSACVTQNLRGQKVLCAWVVAAEDNH